jgi:hypothetical protein
MLGKHQSLGDVNWDNLVSRVGKDQLTGLVGKSKLVGLVNWTMLPFMSDILSKLQTEIFPRCPKQERIIFIDLADPEKRTHADILAALRILSGLQGFADLILGLNLKESTGIAEVLGIPLPSDPEPAIEQTAASIRRKLELSCVVIHPRKGAAAATPSESAQFAGPFVEQPKISTGAGDHFNAGFCVGRLAGLTLEESLCAGVGTSGYYVRTAQSPTGKELATFIAELPPPQS